MKETSKSVCHTNEDDDSYQTVLYKRDRYAILEKSLVKLWLIKENTENQYIGRRYDVTDYSPLKLWIIKDNSRSVYIKNYYNVKQLDNYCDTIMNTKLAKDNIKHGDIESSFEHNKTAQDYFSITLNLLPQDHSDPEILRIYEQAQNGKQQALYKFNKANTLLNCQKEWVNEYLNNRFFIKATSHPDDSKKYSIHFSKKSKDVMHSLSQLEK